MALRRILYPLDLTGTAVSNRLTSSHTIGTDRYRAIVPEFGPFFANSSLVVREVGSETPLIRGVDYECLYYYDYLSADAGGKDIEGVILITNENVGTEIETIAQYVGGHYCYSALGIKAAIDALSLDNRTAVWASILLKPDTWQPSPHAEDIGNVFGFEFIIDMLGSIESALLVGDNAVHATIIETIRDFVADITQLYQQHITDYSNVHRVTAAQTGAYTTTQVDDLLTALGKRVDALTPILATINSDIDELNDLITALTSTVSSWGVRIAALEQDQAQKDQLIATINADIDTINQAIDTIEADIAAMKLKDTNMSNSISTLQSAVTALQNSSGSLASRVGSLETRAGGFDTALANHSASITALWNNFGNYVPYSRLTGNTYETIINRVLQCDGGGSIEVGRQQAWHYPGYDAPLVETLQYGDKGWEIYNTGYYNCIDIKIRSDIRDKLERRTVTAAECYEQVMEIGDVISYRMVGERHRSQSLIAQSVLKKHPLAVTNSPVQNAKGHTVKWRLNIRPMALISSLIGAFRHQDERVAQLEQANALLSEQLSELTKLVVSMQSRG